MRFFDWYPLTGENWLSWREMAQLEWRKLVYFYCLFTMFRALLFCTAALLLYHTLHKPSCGQCQSCKTNLAGKLLTASYPLAGAVYAAIPCAPLVLALGYAASMKPVAAAALLVGFGLANSLVPLLLYAPLTGAVVKRLREQAPGLMKWIRCAAAVVLLALTLVV